MFGNALGLLMVMCIVPWVIHGIIVINLVGYGWVDTSAGRRLTLLSYTSSWPAIAVLLPVVEWAALFASPLHLLVLAMAALLLCGGLYLLQAHLRTWASYNHRQRLKDEAWARKHEFELQDSLY